MGNKKGNLKKGAKVNRFYYTIDFLKKVRKKRNRTQISVLPKNLGTLVLTEY